MNAHKISSATFYIPSIQKWASITGACLRDGKFRLVFKTDDNDIGLMSLEALQALIERFPVPF